MCVIIASMRIETLVKQLRRANDANPEKATVSWLDFDIDEDELLDAMEVEFPRPDYAVSITRNGLTKWARVKRVAK